MAKRKWMVVGIVVGVFVAGTACRAQTPKPGLVVLSKGANELEFVDPVALKVVGKAETGPIPHEVAVSADGKIAVVTNYGAKQDGTTLSVIDLVARKEIHRVELGDLVGPHGVEFFDGKAWFTAEGSKSIGRYDPQANKVDWIHEIGQSRTHMLVLSKEGRAIYTANVNSNSVTAVEANADRSVWKNTVIAVGNGPEAIDLSPDGLRLWVGNSGDGTVSIIDTATKKVIRTTDVGTEHSNRLKFTPDGKLVLISDIRSGELVVVDAASRQVVKRMKLGNSAEGILVQPDGARAYVAVSGENKVVVVDLKKWEVTGEIDGVKEPDGMAWVE
jgi:YVTN family beta-propeller protein